MEKINEEKAEWEVLLDKIKKRGNLKSDAEAAEVIKISKQAVSKWRVGKAEPDVETIARMKDLAKYQGARNAILTIFPKKLASEIIEWNNQITTQWNKKRKEKN